jgi:hypothetical protein
MAETDSMTETGHSTRRTWEGATVIGTLLGAVGAVIADVTTAAPWRAPGPTSSGDRRLAE